MKFWFSLILVMITFQMAGCTNQKKTALKIGISTWPGYEPLVLALENKYYDNVDVRIVRFSTPTESYRALRDGAIDVAAFTADEVLYYARLKKNPKIFHVLDISNGADALVVRPDIEKLDDLKGTKVGIENSTLDNYMVRCALDFSESTTVNDLTLVPLEINEHAEAYASGKVDALVTYEPAKTHALNFGAHVIFSSKQIPYEVADILVADEKTLETKEAALKEIVAGWYKAIEYIQLNKEKAYSRMAQNEGISDAEFESAFASLIIPTRSEVKGMLNHGDKSLIPVLNRMVEIMNSKDIFDKKIDVESILTSDIVD